MAEPNTKQCWECRGRRLVCDFTRPECQKCKTRGVVCPGYDGAKPLRWLQPQQVKAKGRRRFDISKGSADPVARNSIAVPWSLKPDPEMSDILEAFEYYNVHICPDLVATGAGGAQSPYFMHLFAAPVLPQSFTHSIVCTALCHRILQSTDTPPSDQAVLARKLQQHRGESLRALRADLDKPEHQTSDWTLASVLLLLLAEIQQSFTPNWRHHSNGAAVMIEMRGGFGDLVFSRPYLRHVFRYYAIIEVMGNTTSPNVGIESARNQLELISLLPVLYGNGLATCFPCPPDLLTEIIHINHLRSRFHGIAAAALDVDQHFLGEYRHSTALDVLRRIRAFSADNWAAGIAFGITKSVTGESAVDAPARFSDWQAVACIFQSAVAIYCIASLLHDNIETGTCHGNSYGPSINANNTDPHLNPQEVLAKARKTCRSILLGRLREVSKCTQLRKVVLWPLVVAGIEAEDEATKRFVLDELRWISIALGTASPLVARDFLKRRVWGFELGRRRWDALFDQSYVFVL